MIVSAAYSSLNTGDTIVVRNGLNSSQSPDSKASIHILILSTSSIGVSPFSTTIPSVSAMV